MKISIITPSFNSGKYIERAIQSVLNQEYNNWEHIIVDGGSTDKTVEILNKYPHLLWISEPDKGQSDAMNKGFAMAVGDIIVYLNSDDAFEKYTFQEVIKIFYSHTYVDMVVGNLYRVYDKQEKQKRIPSISLFDILIYSNFNFPLNSVAYFYKKNIQKEVGKFPVDNHFTMDYWFLLRAYVVSNIYKSNLFFGTFYFDDKNKSANAARGKKWLKKVRNDFLIENPKPIYFKHLIKYNLIKLINRNSFLKKITLMMRGIGA